MGGPSRYEDANFGTYIYRVLKQVHPDSGMSGDGLSEMNNLIRISLRKIANAVNQLMMNSKGKKTIGSREIQSATRLAFPGELAKHAVSEGTKAVTKYNSHEGPAARDAQGRARPVSRGNRAGLLFPVTRIETIMMELSTVNRKSAGSAVYLAAVLEYLCGEILELAGNAARDNKKVRITPRHLKLAILNDEELSRFFKGVIMSGGVLPNINRALLKGKDEEEKAPRKKTRKPVVPTTPKKKSKTPVPVSPKKKKAPVKGKAPKKAKKASK